jgi:drug/metabolite transporter (DMT)-like permease
VIDSSTGAGLAVAVVASACYETGYAFQALEARSVSPRYALRASLLSQLAGNGRWLAATGLSVLGWPLQVAALTLAPLALVQPTLALGLLLLLGLGARVLGEAVGRRELAAVALVVAGIAGIALSAPGRGSTTVGAGALVALALLGAVAATPYLIDGRQGWLPAVLSAGAADSVAALAAKLVAGAVRDERWIIAVALAALAALAGVLATISEMSALQRSPATRVGPIVLAMQIVIPVVLGATVAGEDWSATPAGGLALVVGLATVVGGASLLAASRAVAAVIEPPPPAPPSPQSSARHR